MTKITLKTLDKIIDSTYESGDEYERFVFRGTIGEQQDIQIRISLDMKQSQELIERMGITYDEESDTYHVNEPLGIEFDEKITTTGKNPKPVFAHKADSFKGIAFDYYELHKGLLIQLKIVSATPFSKKSKRLFAKLVEDEDAVLFED